MPESPQTTILHVDDNETNRYIVTRMLRNAGYAALEAATGTEALQVAIAQSPDLIILDVQLPDLTGFEVCGQLKANPVTASIPILHLSATFVAGKDKAQGLDSGADGYLAQPVEAIELIATVRALLRMRKAEESALSLATEWQTTFDAMNDGVFLLNSQGRVLRCNMAMSQFLNKPYAEIIGYQHQDLLLPILGMTESSFLQVQKTQGRESLEVHIKGQWYAVTVDPMYDQHQAFSGAVYTVADITKRRRAEQSVRFLSEASAVLSASLDCKITLNNLAQLVVPAIADLCFFDVIGADERLERVAWQHGDPAHQQEFERVQTYVPPHTAQNHPLIAVLATGESCFVPHVTDEWLQAVAFSSEHLEFMQGIQYRSLLMVPLIANDKTLGALTLAMTTSSGRYYNLADLALAEDLARRAALALTNARLYRESQETNRMKDEFLATLSHELRSPLNSMLGWAKLLNTRKFDEATTKRAIEIIERNARAQAQLVEDLLDVSRIIQGKFRLDVRPVTLLHVVESALEAVRPAADAKEIRLQAVLDPAAGSIAGDSNRLQQVFWNLLSNAIKFTPKGGRVHVRLERVNSHIEIIFADSGQGIEPEFVPYVFERFRQGDSSITRSFNGLGLGLAIVRHLVELHGGTVHVDSLGKGQGATFTVKLPLIPILVEVNAPERVHPTLGQGISFDNPPSLKGVRVLVVDDERDSRDFIAMVLEECGAVVTTAGSVSEAFATLEKSSLDVLVSDIGMPVEDGYSLIRRIRAQEKGDRGIPAVALTAYARVEDRTRAIYEGFQMHLPKPVEPTELATVVASLASRIRKV
jgi:signal transduction histidine kinase/DNA-binding response OmpR family regulator